MEESMYVDDRVKSKLEQRIDAIAECDLDKIESVKSKLDQIGQFCRFAEKIMEQIQTSDNVSLQLARDIGYAEFWLEENEEVLDRFQVVVNFIQQNEIDKK
jgi:hypothetical protein